MATLDREASAKTCNHSRGVIHLINLYGVLFQQLKTSKVTLTVLTWLVLGEELEKEQAQEGAQLGQRLLL